MWSQPSGESCGISASSTDRPWARIWANYRAVAGEQVHQRLTVSYSSVEMGLISVRRGRPAKAVFDANHGTGLGNAIAELEAAMAATDRTYLI